MLIVHPFIDTEKMSLLRYTVFIPALCLSLGTGILWNFFQKCISKGICKNALWNDWPKEGSTVIPAERWEAIGKSGSIKKKKIKKIEWGVKTPLPESSC